MAVEIRTSPAFEAGVPHELFQTPLGRGSDLSADGQRLLIEQIQLNVPMKPLCRVDCAGLCPRCGVNLNSGPCGCAGEQIDPRWKALEALREKKNEH